VARRSLLDLFEPISRPFYDWMYRRGAPWESGPRPELVALVESGAVTPDTVGPRAIDIGCGSGADTVFLAEQGFEVVGFDLSSVAIEKAREAAAAAGVTPELIVANIFDLPVQGPFDFLFDGGTIDDFPRSRRPEVVEVLDHLSRPGSILALWCFYGHDADLPRVSFGGPSRWGAPGIEPEEIDDLFGRAWEISPVSGGQEERTAFFRLTRM
jgi:SAM-dependent methyltransferase